MANMVASQPLTESIEPCRFPQLNKAFEAPAVQCSHTVELSPEWRAQLSTACKNHGIELSAVFQATWALVLRTYVGSESVLFGCLGDMPLGTGKNLLVCSNQFDLEDKVLKHLTRSSETMAASSSWAVDENDAQSLGHGLFDSLIMWGDRTVGKMRAAEQNTSYAISANLKESAESLSVTIEHDTSLVDEIQGRRIANTTCSALMKIIANPLLKIKDLSLVDDEDLKKIWEWNGVLPEDPKVCAHHLFEQQVSQTPEEEAIFSWDGSVTYSELEKLSSALGSHLSSIGVGPGMIVPICFEKCRWTIVAMLAVLKAGAAFTTLDPVQPTDRLKDTIQETRSKLLLASSSQIGRFEVLDWEILTNIPELSQQTACTPYSPLSLSVKPTDLSYVAFTSGSTGKPKGVSHQHLAVCTSILGKSRDGSSSGYGPGGRILQFASQAFAASVVEILKTLGNGGCICIPKVRLDGLGQYMTEARITRCFLTPSLLKLFKPENFPTLQILLVGGEPVLPELIETWASKLRLIEAVGMTEGVAIQTNIHSDGKMTRIGQTMSGVPWIVDPDDFNKLAPLGALGELLVEGPCLASGYLHDEEKTNASFIEAPLWARKKDYPGRKFRLYRTGDMARYFSDGVIRLLGRRDNRVKLNGQRIELADVEHHMEANLPAGMAAAANVVTSKGSKDKSFLVGFIFPTTELGKHNEPITTSDETRSIVISLLPELRQKLALKLPFYMVPAVFLPLDRRPMNLSGKMDRKRLCQLASELSADEWLSNNKGDAQKNSPSTPMEKAVQALWAEVFGVKVDSLGLEDNFFMHGGDSITAMKLARLARDRGLLLMTGEILQNPSLGGISHVAKVLEKNGSEAAELRIERHSSIAISSDTAELKSLIGSHKIEEVARATDWQSFAVYSGLLKTRGWTDYLTFDFKGSLNMARLESACKLLTARFSILRTLFVVHRRRVLQVVLEDYPFSFANYEVAVDGDIATISKQIFADDASSTSSLGEPLVKFFLVKKDATSHRLLIRISHAQYDVMSLGTLFRTLKDAYAGVELHPSPSFMDFINHTSGAETESEVFWRKSLAGSEMTQILTSVKPTYTNVIDTALLRKMPLPSMQEYGITTASLVLSAWALALGKITGKSDIVFGNLTSGRHATMDGIEEVVGPCMNITPLRARITESKTVLEFLRSVQVQQLCSLSYEHLGFRRIIEKCTSWAPHTRFSTIVNHVHVDSAMADLFTLGDDLHYDFGVFEPAHDKSDLWLQTKHVGDQMEIELRYSGRVIPKGLAEKAIGLFCEIIQKSPKAGDVPLSTFIDRFCPKVATSIDPFEKIRQIVEAAWAKILLAEGDKFDVEKIGLDTPFYSVWGDLIAAAALCKIYRAESFDICVEDVVDNPSMQEQMELLASRVPKL